MFSVTIDVDDTLLTTCDRTIYQGNREEDDDLSEETNKPV
jgi:hypothetical protein